LIVNANSPFPDLSPRAEPPRTSCMKPLFARAVRLSVVHSEIRRVRHACDAVRVWLPRRRDCPFHRLLGVAVESGGVERQVERIATGFLRPTVSICTIMCTRFLQGISSGCLCPAERDRENAQVTTSDLPDAHADHPHCLLTWARMLNPVLCRCGHGRREWPTTSF
jgi:hypothetical protein